MIVKKYLQKKLASLLRMGSKVRKSKVRKRRVRKSKVRKGMLRLQKPMVPKKVRRMRKLRPNPITPRVLLIVSRVVGRS